MFIKGLFPTDHIGLQDDEDAPQNYDFRIDAGGSSGVVNLHTDCMDYDPETGATERATTLVFLTPDEALELSGHLARAALAARG